MPGLKPPSPNLEQLKQYAEMLNQSRTLKSFGVRVAFPSTDKVVAELDPIAAEHRGGLGTSAVNGGILAAIFDLVIGCTPALVDPTRRSATIHLSISFERPVLGDRLRAEAQVDTAGASTVFSSAWVVDQTGAVCARCHGIARMSRQPWSSNRIN